MMYGTPRIIHRLYCLLTGRWWLPCPGCGKMFGSHEAAGTLMIGPATGLQTCGCVSRIVTHGVTDEHGTRYYYKFRHGNGPWHYDEQDYDSQSQQSQSFH